MRSWASQRAPFIGAHCIPHHHTLMKSKLLTFSWLAAISAVCPLTDSHAATYEWGFTSGDLTPDLGSGTMTFEGMTSSISNFATTNGTTVPNINSVPASYLGVPVMPDASYGYNVEFTNSGGNGGSTDYINLYTFIFDIYAPNPGGWMALLNTNPANTNDADFYVDPSGFVGIGDLGYSGAGAFSFDAWHRLVITADLGAGDVRYFVDGTKVFDRNGGSLLDGRFALFSNVQAGADVRLFNENDTSGNYTHAAYLSAFAFEDRTYSDSEVATLGGPNAAGILVPEPAAGGLLLLGVACATFRRQRRRQR